MENVAWLVFCRLIFVGCKYQWDRLQKWWTINFKGSKVGKITVIFSFATMIYNKNTKKLCIIHSDIEFLSPSFKDQETSLNTADKNEKNLTELFGSSRKQKILKDRKQYSVGSEVISEIKSLNKLTKAEAKLDMENSKTNDGFADVQSVLPKFDLETNDVASIYDLDELFGGKKRNDIDQIAQSLVSFKCGEKKDMNVSCTVKYRLQKIFMIKNTDVNAETQIKLQLLGVLNSLIELYLLNNRAVRSKFPLPNLPKNFSRYLLDSFTLFTSQESKLSARTITPSMKSKLRHYIIILLLKLDNYSVDIVDDIKKDLQISEDQLRKEFTFVGCKLKRVNSSEESSQAFYRATLTAPLKLPSLDLDRIERRK